jgi:hypothetical protein
MTKHHRLLGEIIMSKPKYAIGDVVQIADDLGPYMSHFPGAGKTAMVIESDPYNDNDAEYKYGLRIENHGDSWWYYESQLTLIQRNFVWVVGIDGSNGYYNIAGIYPTKAEAYSHLRRLKKHGQLFCRVKKYIVDKDYCRYN